MSRELDSKVREAMGRTIYNVAWSGDALAAMLRFHAEAGRGVDLDNFGFNDGHEGLWRAQVRVERDEDDDFYRGHGASPGEALARATAEWHDAQRAK